MLTLEDSQREDVHRLETSAAHMVWFKDVTLAKKLTVSGGIMGLLTDFFFNCRLNM